MSKRIFVHTSTEENACVLYRNYLPVSHCYHELTKHNIRLIGDSKPKEGDLFDLYMLNRVIIPKFYDEYVSRFKDQVIWQSDDDIWNIPEWNPSTDFLGNKDLEYTWKVIESCKKIFVSTEPLARLARHPEKTAVLPNLIDTTYFDYDKERKDDTGIVKIVWMGSSTHDMDLEQIIEPIVKISEKYGEKVAIIFWGYLPTALGYWERKPGYPIAFLFPKYKNVYFGEWFSGRPYYNKLNALNADIAIMPLHNCKFNESKCITGDSLIPTSKGLIQISEIKDGKVVLEDAKEKKIINNFYYSNRKTLKIKTKLGYEIEATLNHKIKMADNKWKVVSDLKVDDKVKISKFDILQKDYQWFSYPLLLTKAVREDLFDNGDPKMMPRIVINERWGRLIGFLIGDGYMHGTQSVGISCSLDYPDILEEVENLFRGIGIRPRRIKKIKKTEQKTEESKGVDVVASSKHLVNVFRFLGFTGVKCKIFEVPKLILRSPKSVIKEFLRGLFESDGKLESCGCSFCTKSKKLASQVQILLLGFGIMSSLVARWNKKYKKYYYHVMLHRQASDVFFKKIGFLSKTKTKKLMEITSKTHSNAYKEWDWTDEIVSIENSRNDVYDIEVDDLHYYLANGFISHNSNLKFLEMSMSGAACIASDLIPYKCVKNNETGILVDTKGWYDAIVSLIEDEILRKKLVKNAQQQIIEEYSWQSPARNLWFDAFLNV